MISYEIPFLFRLCQNLIIFKNSDRYRRLFSREHGRNSSLITDPTDSCILIKNEFSKDPRDKKWLKYGTKFYRGSGDRRYLISPSIITFLLYFLNAREPLLSNGSRAFKNYNKKVIIDEEIKYRRYVPASYVEILDCFRVGLVPICT